MDRLTIIMVKAALVWLVMGVVIGRLMLVDRGIPGNWRQWLLPTHGHMLFVGCLVQFAFGIVYWLLSRKRSVELPAGYRESTALAGAVMLNLLALRVLGEPPDCTSHASNVSLGILAAYSMLQVVAIVIFAAQL